jgi:hypothetical protein
MRWRTIEIGRLNWTTLKRPSEHCDRKRVEPIHRNRELDGAFVVLSR